MPRRTHATCIYCDETKPLGSFNREHVVPDSFGKFEQSLVLHRVVCLDCNSHFSKTIDLALGRDSIEGLDRLQRGIAEPPEHALARRGRLRMTLSGGPFDGAILEVRPATGASPVAVYPINQVGFARSEGERHLWFPVDELPTKPELHGHGFQPGQVLCLRIWGTGDYLEAGQAALTAKGYAPRDFGEDVPPPEEDSDGTVPIRINGTIERTLLRAAAKAAFNYLALHYEGIARMDQFAEVRRFIRYADWPSRAPVTVIDESILEEFKDTVPVGHIVTVRWSPEEKRVIGQVSFLGWFQYRITLASDPFVIAPDCVASGHFFDPFSKKIHKLQLRRRTGAA